MNPTTATLLRSVLKVGAGWFIAQGWTDDSSAELIIGGLVALIGVLWGIWQRKHPPSGPTPVPVRQLGAIAVLAVPFFLLPGCARFSTTQRDLSYDNNGKPLRAITTHAASHTFFASNSKLATWQASQSDKNQGASVGGLEQSSSGAAEQIGAILGQAMRVAAGLPKTTVTAVVSPNASNTETNAP